MKEKTRTWRCDDGCGDGAPCTVIVKNNSEVPWSCMFSNGDITWIQVEEKKPVIMDENCEWCGVLLGDGKHSCAKVKIMTPKEFNEMYRYRDYNDSDMDRLNDSIDWVCDKIKQGQTLMVALRKVIK